MVKVFSFLGAILLSIINRETQMRLVVVFTSLWMCSFGAAYAVDLQTSYSPPLTQDSVIPVEQSKLETQVNAEENTAPRFYIGLIIDDMGYRYQSGKRAINLPANITYSFLPYSPHARKLANLANEKNKEIMLHIPMEATSGKKLGPGGLTLEMPKAIFDLELAHNLSAIPYIKGVNNHMGSLLTEQNEQMAWLMEALATKEIYFVDSRTSVKSVALKAARNIGIRSDTRDVFVDHDLNEKSMLKQLDHAIQVAKRKGSAVVIAHPFPETIKVLEQWLPRAKALGLEFVYMSDLLKIRKDFAAQRTYEKRLTQWQAKHIKTTNN